MLSDVGMRVQPSAAPRPNNLPGDALRVIAVFLAFATFAVLSWESFGSWEGPAFFYPAAGVTAAAMMLSRRALWPWIAVAIVAAEMLVDTRYGSPWWVSAGFATANVVEPIIGASLVLAWCRGRPDLRVRREFNLFIAGACLVAPVFGALIGGTVSSIHDGTTWHGATASWWAGDALGVLVMAAPILLWTVQSAVVRRRPWEMAAVLAVTAGLSMATFWTHFSPTILVLPVLAWAGFRLNMLGAAIGGVVAAFLANVMSTRGEGPFSHSDMSPAGQVALTQIYVAVIVVVAMLIAQEAAARLNAVREREAEHRERIRLETLSLLALQLSAALTPQDIGEALEDQVLNEAGARALVFGLVSTDGGALEWVTTAGFPQSMLEALGSGMPVSRHSVLTDVVRYGEPIEIGNAQDYAARYPDMVSTWKYFGAESVVGLPLSSGGHPFGAILLLWNEAQVLDDALRAYMSAAATMVSQALVRARIYADEHARAAVLHSVAQPVASIDAVGLQYGALYEPAATAQALGGDWYSVMALPGDRTYLAVGDVIGHGLLSVEDMAQLRTTGNAYAHMGLSPAQVLAELNRFTAHQIDGEFATSLVAIFDPHGSTLSYSSAGHLPALLRRAATGEVIRLSDAQNPLLGPFEDSVYLQNAVAIHPGDVLIMYTDGLVEHFDSDLHTGIGHLEQVVASRSPEALLDCQALAEQVAPSPHADDICLLAVRFGPPNTT